MKAKDLTFIHLILTLIGGAIQTILLSDFYSRKGIQGYSFTQYFDRLIVASITYTLATITFLYVTYYTSLSISIVGDDRKRDSLTYLRNFYLFLLLSIITLFLGVLYLFTAGISSSSIELLGLRIYPYPLSIGIATILGFAAIINLFIFGYNEYIGRAEETLKLASIGLLIVAIMISIWPNNYYGVYSLENPPDIRPYTNLLLMAYYLLSLFLIAPRLYSRSKTLTGLASIRMRMMAWGYVVGIGFFIFYFMDTIWGGGLPYTFWMFLAWFSMMTASFLLYLGLLTPKWLEERLRG